MILDVQVLTVKAPITTKFVCFCHLLEAFSTNSVEPGQTAPTEQSDLDPHCLPPHLH